MIARIWHGWTTPQNAGTYEKLLNENLFVRSENRRIKGDLVIQLLRRSVDQEVEFTASMGFDSVDNVKFFMGKEDHEEAPVPDVARALRTRFNARVVHSTLVQVVAYFDPNPDFN